MGNDTENIDKHIVKYDVAADSHIKFFTDANKKIAVKYKIKDSVFTNLFKDKKYLLQLYKTLHPEDTEVTQDALTDITIHNILTDAIYNDLGFVVGDRLVVLVEAQSTWTENMVIRNLIYMVTTYQDYLVRTKQDVYKSKKVKLPKPELYVVYTGYRENRPEYIKLSESFFDGQICDIEVKVKMIYGKEDGKDIISQYVTFTKIYDEQRRLYGRTEEAIIETINICKNKNVLKEYLESKEGEVHNIMLALYDDEEIIRNYVEGEIREAKEKAEREAKEKAEKEVKEKIQKQLKEVKGEAKREAKIEAKIEAEKSAMFLLKTGKLTVDEISQSSGLSIDEVENLRNRFR